MSHSRPVHALVNIKKYVSRHNQIQPNYNLGYINMSYKLIPDDMRDSGNVVLGTGIGPAKVLYGDTVPAEMRDTGKVSLGTGIGPAKVKFGDTIPADMRDDAKVQLGTGIGPAKVVFGDAR